MRQRRIVSSTGLGLAAVLAVSVIIIVNALFTSDRLDLTENHLFTLSKGTLNILHSLKEPITLNFYYSRSMMSDYPQLRNYASRVRDLLGEYQAKSNGKVTLNVISPEPFSDAEDDAVAAGLKGITVNQAGDRAYFGLVGTNSTDDQQTIPFFDLSRQEALEYDVTKLIYNLAHPNKRVVGIISSLPLFGDPDSQHPKPWTIVDALRQNFKVKDLGLNPQTISSDINVLMVVHPKKLKARTEYAIDQYLLKGGKAMLFVDPLAEQDRTRPDPAHPYVLPQLSSNMKFLFDAWGIKMLKNKIAGDINAAMQVQTNTPKGPEQATYLPWLHLDSSNFNHHDFTVSQLQDINMATAGILEQEKNSPVKFTPLIQTSKASMPLERDLILFQHDPNVIMSNFKPDGKKLTLAARISGHVKTAFPNGPPISDPKEQKKVAATQVKQGHINAIVVADTDILADMFWVRKQNMFGIDVPRSIADNGDFIVNAVENLSGSNDLISLRSRGEYSRPFTVVEKIQRDAQKQFHDQEQKLQAKLHQTEEKLQNLQKKGTGRNGHEVILSSQEKKEIERFRQDQIETRKQLRHVQHELRKNIERLGTELKFINIGLMPLIITLLALLAAFFRSRKQSRG